jgi:hypothetical protein
MKLLVFIVYLLGVFTGYFSTVCVLARAAQKGRYWFGEHKDV